MTYYGSQELATAFRTVRTNTIKIAEDIPEDKYAFRPAPGAMSVAETLAHIAANSEGQYDMHAVKKITSFIGLDFDAWRKERAEAEAALGAKGKSGIVDALRRNGDQWASYLAHTSEADLAQPITFPSHFTPPSKSRFEMLLSAKEHEMHHRGQLMVVERLLGIVPHLTREREARMGAPAR
ncbi:MAG TPA: DinB family protein [Vicinamibacterales bacterium]